MAADTYGDYNAAEYNQVMYNDNDIFLSLLETLTSTDSTTEADIESLKTEVLALADTLQKFFEGQILAEYVVPTDVLLNEAQIAKLESMSLTDAKTLAFLKACLETLTLADVYRLATSKSLVDAVVLLDILSKFISNKGLSDSIRLQDWLNMKKNPAAGVWSN